MKNILVAIGLMLAVLPAGMTAGVAMADPPPHSNPYTEDAPSHPRGPVSGVVANVDYGAGRLNVNSHGRSIAIVVTPGTAIYRNDKYATLTDLQPGMRVDVSVNEVDGNLIAQTIRIH